MVNILILPLIILFLLVGIVSSLSIIFAKNGFGFWANLRRLGGLLLLLGSSGFIVPIIIKVSGVNLPSNLEWPIAYSHSVLEHTCGLHILPHKPTGRIQIYDRSFRFIKAVRHEHRGEILNITAASDCSFHVLSYIKSGEGKKTQYDIKGEVLATELADRIPPRQWGRSIDRKHLKSGVVPTPFYLWSFSHPAISWIYIILSFGIIRLTDLIVKNAIKSLKF